MLPYGIIGRPNIKKVELLYSEEDLPFMRKRQINDEKEATEFFVIEPHQATSQYEIEISVEDMSLLKIESSKDVYLFNIVTVRESREVTISFVAPIVFNKNTLKGSMSL